MACAAESLAGLAGPRFSGADRYFVFVAARPLFHYDGGLLTRRGGDGLRNLPEDWKCGMAAACLQWSAGRWNLFLSPQPRAGDPGTAILEDRAPAAGYNP